jgi:hypothetical protein
MIKMNQIVRGALKFFVVFFVLECIIISSPGATTWYVSLRACLKTQKCINKIGYLSVQCKYIRAVPCGCDTPLT